MRTSKEEPIMAKIENGDTLPTLTACVVGDGSMTLPDDLKGSWSVMVFYRGHW